MTGIWRSLYRGYGTEIFVNIRQDYSRTFVLLFCFVHCFLYLELTGKQMSNQATKGRQNATVDVILSLHSVYRFGGIVVVCMR